MYLVFLPDPTTTTSIYNFENPLSVRLKQIELLWGSSMKNVDPDFDPKKKFDRNFDFGRNSFDRRTDFETTTTAESTTIPTGPPRILLKVP